MNINAKMIPNVAIVQRQHKKNVWPNTTGARSGRLLQIGKIMNLPSTV